MGQFDETNLLREMIRIRTAEETIATLYAEQEMRTPTHFSIGQEAVAVGVMAALQPDDVVWSGHRCHAEYLAKGGDLTAMIAELYGRVGGCCKGRGGSVHLNAPEVGHMASSAILGETVAAAVGAAWAFKLRGEDRVSVCFFGDAVPEEGVWHESLNFAVVHALPVLFVCVNNGYSTHTPMEVRQPRRITIRNRASAYGFCHHYRADGNDVIDVAAAAEWMVEGARRGSVELRGLSGLCGPAFLEAVTYRYREHVGPNFDYEAGYRSREEVEYQMAHNDPIKREANRLIHQDLCTRTQIDEWQAEAQREVDAAVLAAQASPFPDPADLMQGVA